MTSKNSVLAVGLIVVIAVAGYYFYSGGSLRRTTVEDLDPTPQNVTLSGTYVCLPHLDTTGPQTEECAFGLKTDDGVYYAVNFGQSATAAEQFQSGAHITAEGFVVIKEALSTDQWMKYNMRGIFTITKMIDPAPAAGAKLNIHEICANKMAIMKFVDAKSAETFRTECEEGKYPEIIENYKKEMGLGDGAAI